MFTFAPFSYYLYVTTVMFAYTVPHVNLTNPQLRRLGYFR